MRKAILVASMLLVAQPVLASCHLHRVWRYPYPQRCGYTRVALAYKPKVDLKNDTIIKKVFAPIEQDPFKDVLVPNCIYDAINERAYGICMLKYKMNK